MDRRKLLVGVGGRLGWVAQLACSLFFMVACLVRDPTKPAALIKPSLYPLPVQATVNQLLEQYALVGTGCLCMRLVRNWLNRKHARLFAGRSAAVTAVGIVGTAATTLIPYLTSFALTKSYSTVAFAAPIYCGCVLALSGPLVLPDRASLALACLFAAIYQVALVGVFVGGWSGKVGTTACLGVVTARAILSLAKRGPSTQGVKIAP
jgi:hypothetical protein